MTKANMMKEAHKLAKTFEGDYTACLALALRTLNKEEETMELQGTEKQIEYATKIRNTKNITKWLDRRAEQMEKDLVGYRAELEEDLAEGDQDDIEESRETVKETEYHLNEWYADKKEMYETNSAARVINIRNKYRGDMTVYFG